MFSAGGAGADLGGDLFQRKLEHRGYGQFLRRRRAQIAPAPRNDTLDQSVERPALAGAVYQYPVGSTLVLERRLLLLDWAERAGAFVIEDDYDSEYRYRGRPIASVQGLDPQGRVVYVGTFAKTMLPALRVGYLIVPEGLQAAFANAVRNTGQTAPQPLQGALAEFIDAGHYGAHVRRMRNLYAKRQTLLFALARKHLAGLLELAPTASGMQVAGWLADAVDDRAVAAAGRRAGLALRPLSPYWVGPAARPGLHLGYAAVPEDAMEPPVQQLARIIERGSRPSAAGGR